MDLFGEEETVLKEGEQETASLSSGSSPSADIVFQHPRQSDFLLGHEEQEKRLLHWFYSKRMPHGLILTGIKGIGKATLAYRFARFLFKYGKDSLSSGQDALFGGADLPVEQRESLHVDRGDPIFSRVASGGHPDLLTIERAYDASKNKTQDSLAVSELRKVEPFLRMTASDGGWRIVIIDDADTMNRNSQNALLKILEEPPKNTLIILVTHRLGCLIPTIRSRTQVLSCQHLPDHSIESFLQKSSLMNEIQREDLPLISALAEGSFGKAIQVIEDRSFETFATLLQLLADFQNAADWPAIHTFAEQCARGGQEQGYKSFADTMLWIFKSLAFAKARGQGIAFEPSQSILLSTILKNSSLAQLLKICDNLSDHFALVDHSNLDRRYGVIGAFQIIAK